MIYVQYTDQDNNLTTVPLNEYCSKLCRLNNSVLYKLENFLGQKMLSTDDLKVIRKIILSVSAKIERLPELIIEGDNY